MLLPMSCPVCGAQGPAPCGRCRAALRSPAVAVCPPGVDSCAAFLDYSGAGRELVARLKYRNARASLPFLAGGMAALADAGSVDVVTWAPTTAVRRRQRGFDQSHLLAQAVARRLGRPCRRLLRRQPGPAQTGRTRTQRWSGVAFEARSGRWPARVLVVDDVVTSGATVAAAAAALRRAGASEVHVVAAARAGGAVHSPMTVCGSVVASRRQSQAKRPT